MASSLVFTARRREPELVAPARPTPHELKLLSDLDDQKGLRNFATSIHFYRASPSMAGRDSAKVVRDALAKALVFHYPLAGRLRELAGGKLAVECTSEGAVFVEAVADVELDQFGPGPQPPFPCLEELIYGAVDYDKSFMDSPLFFVQVTRLKCGGFVFGYRINHAVADGAGVSYILHAMVELARGAEIPSVPPVWARELLMARDPPRVTHAHFAYDEVRPRAEGLKDGELVLRMFFFSPKDLAALWQRLPQQLRVSSTRFEVLTACLWRSRAIALSGDPEDEVRLRFTLNGRNKCNPPLPAGYYGNAIAYPVARATLGELSRNPLGYAVELVKEAKASITAGYMQSSVDYLVLNGRPGFTHSRTFLVSDVTRMGFDEMDFGWGPAAYAGPAVGGGRVPPRYRSHYIRAKNEKGEDGILVPVQLPPAAMERFEEEVERLVKEQPVVVPAMKEEQCSSSSSLAFVGNRGQGRSTSHSRHKGVLTNLYEALGLMNSRY